MIGLRVDCPETVCDDDEGEQGADKVYAEIKTLERFLSVMIGGEQKHVEEEVGCDGHQHGQDDRAHGRDGLVTMEALVDQGWHVAVWCCEETALLRTTSTLLSLSPTDKGGPGLKRINRRGRQAGRRRALMATGFQTRMSPTHKACLMYIIKQP